MTTVADLAAWLEGFAPRSLAESWDNVGLLWGDPAAPASRVMTCLTLTDRVAQEAIDAGVGAIVSHHPILFKPTQAIRADLVATGFLWRLAHAGVAVLSPHTAFDNTIGGINDGLAARLGLEDVGPLRPGPPGQSFKVVVFVPRVSREEVVAAAYGAGAGRIGDYDECSFSVAGRGTFLGRLGTNPTVGRPGRRESVRELRVEMVCPAPRVGAVVASIRMAHPYEEPAIDIVPLAEGPPTSPGTGRLGSLPEAETLGSLATRVGRVLQTDRVEFVGHPQRMVRRLAIVCGAGDDFLGDAARVGADALLTGEARFHRGIEAEAIGVGLIVAGHHATERPGVEDLAGRIAAAFPTAEVWASREEVDPFRSAIR